MNPVLHTRFFLDVSAALVKTLVDDAVIMQYFGADSSVIW